MVKKSRIIGLFLSLVFIFTGIFSVGVSAEKKYKKAKKESYKEYNIKEKRVKLAYEIMEQHAIAWHHFMYALKGSKLKIGKTKLVDHEDFKNLDRKKKFSLSPRNVLKKVKEANDEEITNFTDDSFIESLNDYIEYADMFDASFNKFMKKYKIEKKLSKKQKKYYDCAKKITKGIKAYLKAIVKAEKKKIAAKHANDDDDEDDEDDEDDD